jgi:hypothetical protein
MVSRCRVGDVAGEPHTFALQHLSDGLVAASSRPKPAEGRPTADSTRQAFSHCWQVLTCLPSGCPAVPTTVATSPYVPGAPPEPWRAAGA